jgi:glycosyltransferase involved in cell wall biosynthesis
LHGLRPYFDGVEIGTQCFSQSAQENGRGRPFSDRLGAQRHDRHANIAGNGRMSGLRFCMVTTFYPPYNFGGDGIGIQRFSQALTRRGHEVTVLQDVDAHNVLRTGPEPSASGESDGVEVVRLRSRPRALSVLLTQQTGLPVLNRGAVRRFFHERRFDVINYHNISLIGGPGVLAYGDAVKLYMAHDHWLVCPTHVLWRHKRELCQDRECVRCSLSYHRPPQLWRHTGYLERQLRHVDAVIAMSEFSRQKHREFGLGRDMEVVNYFLPERPLAVSAAGSPHERPYFLFVGRLEKIKGLDDVIPLFARYEGADLLVAGDGEYAAVLRELAKGIDRVKFLGKIDSRKLDLYYHHALALIVPSVCFETFGIILIEAFRQGTPVLARRLGPFPEIVERARGGLLFDRPAELLESMRRIQADTSLRASLSASALEGFARNWSENAVMPRYLEVVKRAARMRERTEVVRALES